KTTFDSIVADFELYGNKVKYDSAKPDEKSDNPIGQFIIDTFRKFKDSKLTITLDKANQIVSVDGVQEGTGITPDSLKSAHKQRLNRLPDDPVKPGDKWERTEEMDLGQGQYLIVKRKFEYAGETAKFPTVKDSPKLDKITATDLSA